MSKTPSGRRVRLQPLRIYNNGTALGHISVWHFWLGLALRPPPFCLHLALRSSSFRQRWQKALAESEATAGWTHQLHVALRSSCFRQRWQQALAESAGWTHQYEIDPPWGEADLGSGKCNQDAPWYQTIPLEHKQDMGRVKPQHVYGLKSVWMFPQHVYSPKSN